MEQLEQQLPALTGLPGTETARVELLLKICWAVSETDDWDRLRAVAGEAHSLAEAVGYRPGIRS